MKALLTTLFLLLALAAPAKAQGTIPISGSQSVNSVGMPLAGCLLYIFQAGTVATPQNAFSDTALTQVLPNPMQCDQNGRLPFFYLANGSVHARLTDSSGVVQFDYPSLLVVGPSSGGGGGQSFDPTAIPVTGDIKFRPTGEALAGWVKLNGQTIGSATSGATGLASATAQALFVYLWNNCSDAHCPLNGAPGNRGASGLADFNANKTLTLLDWRSRSPLGLTDMGNSNCSGVRVDCILSSNVTSGGGDTTTTANATGGTSNTTLGQANLPNVALPITSEPTISLSLALTTNITDPGHTHSYTAPVSQVGIGTVGGNTPAVPSITGGTTGSSTTGITASTINNGSTATNSGGSVSLGGSGTSFGNISPFILGTFYMKL